MSNTKETTKYFHCPVCEKLFKETVKVLKGTSNIKSEIDINCKHCDTLLTVEIDDDTPNSTSLRGTKK